MRVRRRRRGVAARAARPAGRRAEPSSVGWRGSEEACEELRTRPTGAIDPEMAWLKLKDARSLRYTGAGRRPGRGGVARAGGRSDRHAGPPGAAGPGHPRHLPAPADDARRAGPGPRRRRAAPPGPVRPRAARRRRRRQGSPPAAVPDAVDELDRSKRPAVTLVSAWVSQVARDARIDTALLATTGRSAGRHPGRPDGPPAHGWRAELRRRRDHPPDGRPRRTDVRRQGQPAPDRRRRRTGTAMPSGEGSGR